MGARFAALALVLAGCSGSAHVVLEGAIETGGGSKALAFVDLAQQGSFDVAAVSTHRGTVDVLTQNADGSWRLMGSFFAGGLAEAVVAGKIGKRGVVAVRDQSGSIALLGGIPNMPHRLDFPIQIYRRFRNGVVVDTVPPARGYGLADLDKDGKDELLVASDMGVAVVENLETLLDANPEKAPPGNGYKYAAGRKPNAVAAVDLEADGNLDLLVTDADEPVLRTYKGGGMRADFQAPQKIALPAPGVQVIGTGCAEWPAVVLLSDGRMVAVTPFGGGKTQLTVPSMTPVKQVISTGSALAIASGASSTVGFYEACGQLGVTVGVSVDKMMAMAATRTAVAGTQQIAVLGEDGNTVSMFKVSSGF